MKTFLRIAIPVPLRRTFDYLLPEHCEKRILQPGIRVVVPFGSRTKIGYLIEMTNHSEVAQSRLKRVKKFLDETPLLSDDDMKFLLWTSRYYHHPVGEVIDSAFPIPLRKGKPAMLKTKTAYFTTELGKKTPTGDLKRAPRQRELLEYIKATPYGLTEKTLNMLNWDWRNSAKQLVHKGIIIASERPDILEHRPKSEAVPVMLNPDQKNAVDQVRRTAGQFSSFLLEGVTGSGKTEVYLRLIEFVLEQGKQVMVLLPEISLTPQLESRFRARLTYPIAIFHSGLTDSERQQSWLGFREGIASVLLGTRSAVFSPMCRPGLIILDEEHDTSFKQQNGFRFSARDIAIARAKHQRIPVIMGSATPSFESYFNVKRGRHQILSLPQRTGNARPPTLKILDIRNERLIEGLSPQLISATQQVLSRGEQAILFINRRGFAPTLICHSCGWAASCRHCDSNLVVHLMERKLRCHHCGYEQPLPERCRRCSGPELQPSGLGTERIEQALRKIFPDAEIARIDRDSTRRKGSLESFLAQVNDGRINLLLGTQMLAKGHHFPKVTLVGIVDVDSGLYSIDFRASERLAQLIVQVAGRAGREQAPGTAILQTHHPDHPLLVTLIHQGYRKFAEMALKERESASLPPFNHQALMRSESRVEQQPLDFLGQVRDLANTLRIKDTHIFGPVSAPLTKKAGLFRFQLLFQSSNRENLHILLESILPRVAKLLGSRRVRWSVDVDPVDLY